MGLDWLHFEMPWKRFKSRGNNCRFCSSEIQCAIGSCAGVLSVQEIWQGRFDFPHDQMDRTMMAYFHISFGEDTVQPTAKSRGVVLTILNKRGGSAVGATLPTLFDRLF